MSEHSPVSFSNVLTDAEIVKMLRALALKAFDLHASSAWGSEEGYAINLAIAVSDQLRDAAWQRSALLSLCADPKFLKSIRLAAVNGDSFTFETLQDFKFLPSNTIMYLAFSDMPVFKDVWDKYGADGVSAFVAIRAGNDIPDPDLGSDFAEAWFYLEYHRIQNLLSKFSFPEKGF